MMIHAIVLIRLEKPFNI